MTEFNDLPEWKKGDVIRAARLGATDSAVRELQNFARAVRASEVISPPAAAEDVDAGETQVSEVWTLIGRDTVTERIEDPDDPNTYVDVTRTVALYYSRPGGGTVKLPTE